MPAGEASDIASALVVGISVVIVTYNNADTLGDSLPALARQLRDGDEIVVVDNASADDSAGVAQSSVPEAVIVRNTRNLGFAGGCNAGAEAASGSLLVFLNPDSLVADGFREAVAGAPDGWGAWMGLVTMDGGQLVNTSGGVLHFTGLGWAGEAGQPVADVPAGPAEVGFASGACLAIPRSLYLELGGFPEHFFMYCEDVDLSLRVRLRGLGVGMLPTARSDHDYEFHKGSLKWRLLERNRLATIVRTYPGALLAVVAPALVATELAIFAAAVAGGWAGQKLLAWWDFARALPTLVRERREIQASRAIGAAEFALWLTPELSSPYLGSAVRSAPVRLMLRAYWRVVTALLR
jgi:N-acetylglucosaminyl-diphospho-decaprenol L-rhamnosyltransferase